MQLKANEVMKYLKYLVSVNDYNQIRKKKSNFNIPENKNTHDIRKLLEMMNCLRQFYF